MIGEKKPTILMILDGFGVAPPSRGNAVTLAKTPVLDRLFDVYPSTILGATGRDVGLEDNKMSGSETGHMNIGAGRVVKQDSAYITESIKDGSFFINPALSGAIRNVFEKKSQLHLMGMMGDCDSPHSDPDHFRAILKLAKKNGISEAYCHFFTDGRDSYPKSAMEHLKRHKNIIQEEGIGKIATLTGRFYAMDRAKNWKRLAAAYDAIVFSKGEKMASPEEAIANAYKKGLTDEYLPPTVIFEKGKPIARLSDNDSIVFYNLRSDRARQFTKFFVGYSKKGVLEDDMPIIDKAKNLYFSAMTDFGPELDVHTVFPGYTVKATLPMALGDLKQMYISETEKFSHVTYFFNGGYADSVNGEDRVMIPSPLVESYVKIPQMSAPKISQKIIESLEKNQYDFITVNFANADIVGHTGDLGATVKAIEILDKEIKKIYREVLKRGGNLVITADHGNAETMIDAQSDQPNTFHTKNPVPFLLVGEKWKDRKLSGLGVLGNIAPTILEIMEIEKPKVMKKNSLLV